MVVVPDQAELEKWAASKGISGSIDQWVDNAKAYELIEGELAKCSSGFKGYERVRKFKMLTEEFTIENGMLTPKMSLKRKVVMDRYGSDLEALYE